MPPVWSEARMPRRVLPIYNPIATVFGLTPNRSVNNPSMQTMMYGNPGSAGLGGTGHSALTMVKRMCAITNPTNLFNCFLFSFSLLQHQHRNHNGLKKQREKSRATRRKERENKKGNIPDLVFVHPRAISTFYLLITPCFFACKHHHSEWRRHRGQEK